MKIDKPRKEDKPKKGGVTIVGEKPTSQHQEPKNEVKKNAS